MSTTYTLLDKHNTILEACERSSRVGIDIFDKDTSNPKGFIGGTGAIYTSEDLISIIVNLARVVASYVSDDAELIKSKIIAAMNADAYLGSMRS